MRHKSPFGEDMRQISNRFSVQIGPVSHSAEDKQMCWVVLKHMIDAYLRRFDPYLRQFDPYLRRKNSQKRKKEVQNTPTSFWATLCVKFDFGQRYGAQHFEYSSVNYIELWPFPG